MDRAGGGTIGRLINFNFGHIDPSLLPRLTHTGLDTDELTEALPILGPLVQNGILTPDDEFERIIRERLGIGDLPEEAKRSHLERSISSKPISSSAALMESLIKSRKYHG